MYTTIQLEAIRMFGRKELEFGCIGIFSDDEKRLLYLSTGGTWEDITGNTFSMIKPDAILGHIPHLEDLFRVAEEKENKDGGRFEVTLEISNFTDNLTLFINGISIPFNPTLPLLEQSESTLTQLLTLFKIGY